MNRRHGFTLIEMLVVITVSTALAGIAVFMLHALMKSHNTGREHLAYCQTLNRLAEQFRGDVHAMQKTASDGNELLKRDSPIFVDTKIGTVPVLDLLPESADGTKIRYQCLQDRIDRTETQGEKIIRQESYMLPPNIESSIKIESLQDATMACIVVSPKRETPKLYYVAPVRIEAVLGRDARLSKVQSPTEGKP
jgi:prepilin-type N-terminal cleavage/methylation domain-containing protein